MKRMDRLIAVLIALQQRDETAQSLADKLEVSKRTIMRDMQSLAEMGVPLYAVPGPSGGYRLMEGFKLAPLQFDAMEALTLLFALHALARLTDSPFREARWTVADKVRSLLPRHTVLQAETMLAHVELAIPERPVKTPLLAELLERTAAQCWITALYRSERHERRLTLKPSKVFASHGFWYCRAYSREHGEERTFRVDRMREIGGPDDCAQLERELTRGEGQSLQLEAPIDIVVRLTYRGALLTEQDHHVGHLVQQLDDSNWQLSFACPAEEWDWAVRFFYSLGLDATVIGPPKLREQLHALGKSVAERYAEPFENIVEEPEASSIDKRDGKQREK